MSVRDRFLGGLARQLGEPQGLRGRLIALGLNRSNRASVSAAVAATQVRPGAAAADIGFGGGVGLPLLLDRVGGTGRVHGVELSATMLDRALRTFAAECAAGQLSLQAGAITDLPLEDGCLDALITVNTIYFVEDLARAFAELKRVLRPSGRLVVGIGDPDRMASMPFTAHGFRLRPVDEVMATLAAAGLTGVRDQRFGAGGRAFHLLVVTRGEAA